MPFKAGESVRAPASKSNTAELAAWKEINPDIPVDTGTVVCEFVCHGGPGKRGHHMLGHLGPHMLGHFGPHMLHGALLQALSNTCPDMKVCKARGPVPPRGCSAHNA